ncbi:MAG: prephenate dehydrogenase/arogenate dehydrogenase family protein [Planctomycetaceae bacterium]
MSEPPFQEPLENTVVIVGVGLIGGSLAAALRSRKVARHVIGVGRDAVRLERARVAGLIDEVSTDVASVAARADVIVFCTPVDRVAEGVRQAARTARPDTLMTDAGSVKQPICDAVADIVNFVGAHPIAGSHRQGFEAADAQLYEGRLCVLTPLESSPKLMVRRLDRLWKGVGMRTTQMSPSEHDQALAMTSHLPHLVAAALAQTLAVENRPLTGTGFRDTTRIAAGDPQLWTGILMQNAQHVAAGIEAVQHQLQKYQAALRDGNTDQILNLLKDGQQQRAALD